MEYTNTRTIWNDIRTRGIQTVRVYMKRPSDDDQLEVTYKYCSHSIPSTPEVGGNLVKRQGLDTGSLTLCLRYFMVTQQPDGMEMTLTELAGDLFNQDSRVYQVWWVDNYYWVVQTDTDSALYYYTECVVKFPTMVTCTYTPGTKLVIEPQSADIETRTLITCASDGSNVRRRVRKFTISYYPADKSFEAENTDTLTYELPIPEDEIERTKQQHTASRIMNQIIDGESLCLPDPTGSNIKDYLTPKSRPYFEYVNKLLTRILKSANNKLVSSAVFGGYVLNLVEHAFEYRRNPMGATYTPPNDIDVWLNYDSSQGSTQFTRNKLANVFKRNIIPYLEEAGHTTTWYSARANHILDYGVHNLVIDGEYRFDFTGNTYGSSLFDELGDFTVNNLFYDVHTGKMSMRIASEYSLLDIISDHIPNRKLVPMLRCDSLQSHICNLSDYDWYHNKMCQRETKTLTKGYKYPAGITNLPDTFTAGMREHLAKLIVLTREEIDKLWL